MSVLPEPLSFNLEYGFDPSLCDLQAPWERVGETYSEQSEDLSEPFFENIVIPEIEPLFVEATQKIAATPSLLLRVLPDGTVRHVSGRSLTLLGMEKKDLLSNPLTQFIHSDDLPALNSTLASLLQGRDLQASYRRLTNIQPGFITVTATLTPILTDDRKELVEILILERLVELKEKSISSIKLQASKYLSLLKDQVDVVLQVTPDHRISFVSDSAALTWGYRPEELVSKSIWTVVHPDDMKTFRLALLSAPASKCASVKTTFRRLRHAGEMRAAGGHGDSVLEEVTIIPVTKQGALQHLNMVSRIVEAPCYSSTPSSSSTRSSTPGSFTLSDDDSSFSSASYPSSPLTSPPLAPVHSSSAKSLKRPHSQRPSSHWGAGEFEHPLTSSWNPAERRQASLPQDVRAWTSPKQLLAAPQFSSISSLYANQPARKKSRLSSSSSNPVSSSYNPGPCACSCSSWDSAGLDCSLCGLRCPKPRIETEGNHLLDGEVRLEEFDLNYHRAW